MLEKGKKQLKEKHSIYSQ